MKSETKALAQDQSNAPSTIPDVSHVKGKSPHDIIRERMEEYFSKVSQEELEADLKKADFDFYNSIEDSPVVYSPPED